MTKIPYDDDSRIVLTLDAGGTTLKFTAVRGNALLFAPVAVPSEAHDLRRCLDNIVNGFRQVEAAAARAAGGDFIRLSRAGRLPGGDHRQPA